MIFDAGISTILTVMFYFLVSPQKYNEKIIGLKQCTIYLTNLEIF